MEKFEYLSPVFKDRLDQFLLNVSKRRIVNHWKNKRPLCKSVEDKIKLFLSIKPLIDQAFKEDFPEDHPDYEHLLDWIANCAASADLLGNIEQRNIWIEIFEACDWVFYLKEYLKKESQDTNSQSL